MKRRVEIISNQEVFNRFFRIEEVQLRHERYDGQLSETTTRLNLDRGDSVAALVHDVSNDTVIFTEQFRYPTYEKGPGWILEIPAGMVEKSEDPEKTVRRELVEEMGYSVTSLQRVTTVYVSPGGTSERIHIYYAAVEASDWTSEGGGVDTAGEDIRSVQLTVKDALRMVESGEIVDAKTVIALQWFALNH